MATFPHRVVLRLMPSQGLSSAEDILVALQFFSGGRPYYGTLMGLTDAQGRVERSFQEIESDFLYDQKLFPMDFRVPLAQCDPRIDLQIQGGREFLDHQDSIAVNPLVTPEAHAQYTKARNQHVMSTQIAIALPPIPQDVLAIELAVVPANQTL